MVSVRTPARLHLGFLDLNASIGRRFGSIGLAVNSHFTHLHVSKAKITHIDGTLNDECLHKLRAIIKRFYQTLGQSVPDTQRAVHIQVLEQIPEHSGLGSGTQLTLALGSALCRLHQLNCSTAELALQLKRGQRSGIGICTFDCGGFVIDGGCAQNNTVPPRLVQLPFPENWRIVMILSPCFQGVHGQPEKQAFQALPAFELQKTQHICHLTLMQLLPSLVEKNINLFGSAITEIQVLLGDHFAPVQGGRYTSEGVAACLEYASTLKHNGIAQSSWGPTGCIFVSNDHEADRLIMQLQQFLQITDHNGENLSIIKASAENRGAIIEIIR